jgi:hypothetical protein
MDFLGIHPLKFANSPVKLSKQHREVQGFHTLECTKQAISRRTSRIHAAKCQDFYQQLRANEENMGNQNRFNFLIF